MSQVGSNVTSVASAMATVATTTGSRVGNESYGLAVVFAESLTASGFDGLYTCLGHFNGTELPLYTILKYRLDVGKANDVIANVIIISSRSSNNHIQLHLHVHLL